MGKKAWGTYCVEGMDRHAVAFLDASSSQSLGGLTGEFVGLIEGQAIFVIFSIYEDL